MLISVRSHQPGLFEPELIGSEHFGTKTGLGFENLARFELGLGLGWTLFDLNPE